MVSRVCEEWGTVGQRWGGEGQAVLSSCEGGAGRQGKLVVGMGGNGEQRGAASFIGRHGPQLEHKC